MLFSQVIRAQSVLADWICVPTISLPPDSVQFRQTSDREFPLNFQSQGIRRIRPESTKTVPKSIQIWTDPVIGIIDLRFDWDSKYGTGSRLSVATVFGVFDLHIIFMIGYQCYSCHICLYVLTRMTVPVSVVSKCGRKKIELTLSLRDEKRHLRTHPWILWIDCMFSNRILLKCILEIRLQLSFNDIIESFRNNHELIVQSKWLK